MSILNSAVAKVSLTVVANLDYFFYSRSRVRTLYLLVGDKKIKGLGMLPGIRTTWVVVVCIILTIGTVAIVADPLFSHARHLPH